MENSQTAFWISLSVCICPQGDFHLGPAFDMTPFHCRCLFILPIKSCKARSFSFKVSSKYGLDITSKIFILANSKEHMTNWCFSVTHFIWLECRTGEDNGRAVAFVEKSGPLLLRLGEFLSFLCHLEVSGRLRGEQVLG